jgi:hypothetical protein
MTHILLFLLLVNIRAIDAEGARESAVANCFGAVLDVCLNSTASEEKRDVILYHWARTANAMRVNPLKIAERMKALGYDVIEISSLRSEIRSDLRGRTVTIAFRKAGKFDPGFTFAIVGSVDQRFMLGGVWGP